MVPLGAGVGSLGTASTDATESPSHKSISSANTRKLDKVASGKSFGKLESIKDHVVDDRRGSEHLSLLGAHAVVPEARTSVDAASRALARASNHDHMRQSVSNPGSGQRLTCWQAVFLKRRKLAPHCRAVNRSRIFQICMFTALLSALFLPDIWILANRHDNKDLDVILTVVLIAFLFELTVQAIGLAKTYFGSFFFWMDLLGAASLLLDLSYLELATLPTRGNSGDSESVSNNVVIMRAARIAKLGARAGRFTRLVKLLRFLPGMREQGADAGTAKVISARLITALSTRVSCLIIVMVMVMPMFSMWTYPEQDWSMKSWLDIIDKTATRHPERLDWQLKKFADFYQSMDYYPWVLRAKADADLSDIALRSLPWISPRGKPDRLTNSNRHESDNIVCEFNFKKPNQIDSLMNVLLLLVVMVLMICFSLVLSNSVSAIVLRPLEKLLLQVRKMASTIFQSVTDMAVTMRDEDDECADDEGEENEDECDHANAFGNETELLEKVVQKLAVLSEITMNKSVVDAETMEGLGEGDRAVIHGFQGCSGNESCPWGGPAEDDDNVDANFDSMLAAQKAMVENAGLSLELLNSWNLNPLELDKARNHAAAMYFVGPHNHGISFDTVVMGHFLEAAEAGYNKSCHYHNWFHAIDVTHCVYRLLEICACEAYLSSAERYGLLVSSVCHDVGHPGMNNTFLIETSHELALRYNDKSPLENMHCARLFEFVSMAKCNIFASLSKPQFQEIRKICIEAILHTDNAQHFAMIKEVQMIYEVNSEILDASRDFFHEANSEILDASRDFFHEGTDEFPTKEAVECFRQPESRRLLVNLILHVSDISNSTKPFRICRIWAWQVLEEFFTQGDTEKRLGIAVQALNDRERVNRAFSQIGFIEFLVSPLLFAVIKVLPPTEPLAEQMVNNVKTWHQQWLAETKPTPSDQDKKALVDRVAKLEQRFHECH
eukprot:TRINITY_DN24855_c0_g2_i1.p1 TRINITY_DN24855_c0_g2~~TRINITY_DN24855_c0_g2_i1.p1  ORF type:complete len:1003 (-),score=207.04 TRINITY_DN24855_c0_g2_i1:122-2974(-)